METLWNKRTLPPPPTLTYAASKDVNTTRFLAHMSTAMGTLKQSSALSNEYAVLDRLLYKFNNQLRKEKVIQTMKMIKQALKRIAEMDMKAEFEKFYDSKQRTDGLKIDLPSKQMLQYLLVRLMGYAKLLIRVGHCCQEAYIYCMQKLGRGDLVRQMLLFASVTSRLWVLSQALGLHAISWYKDLYGYLEILEGPQVDWLPPKETLPPDLHDWLEIGKDLGEPKVHTGVYNLGLSDKSKVNLDDLLSKFSEEQCPSPTCTGGDETTLKADKGLDDPEGWDETLCLHQTMEPFDGDRVAKMDVNDYIDNLYSYGQVEDVGVSVTVNRSEFSQKKSPAPANHVVAKESAPTVPKPVPDMTIAHQDSEKQKTGPTTGMAEQRNLTSNQKRKLKDNAKQLKLKEKRLAKRKKRKEKEKTKMLKLAVKKQNERAGGKLGDKSKQTTSVKSSVAVEASSSKSSVAEWEGLSLAKRHELAVIADEVYGAERPAKKLKPGHDEGKGTSSAAHSVVKGFQPLSAEKRKVLAALSDSVKKHKKRKRGRTQ
ncbi:uncharacterized protein LOC135484537 [Lineus longissimus]|uniref:uncharacterized protein LOC135484537 n=1 Tax=Lineus longissimus TaxID=88925 RepID=UPI002B4E834E